jgi:hypothetical protein
MDKTRLRAIKLVMFSLLAFGSTAPAQADGVYIGAGIYRADTDAGHDTTPSGFIGYNFLDTNFFMASVEAGYYDLGNTSNNSLKLDASAITAGGVLALPLGPIFEFYAKGGLAFLDAETKTSGMREQQNDQKAYYGVGASLDILDTIDIYAEYLYFDTSYDAGMAGVGVKFSF